MDVETILEEYNRGEKYEGENDLTGAMLAYNSALNLDKERKYSSMVHFRLGMIYVRKNQVARAIEEFRKTIDDAHILNAKEEARNQLVQLAAYNLGKSILDQIQSGNEDYRLDEAEEWFNRALVIPINHEELLQDARTDLGTIKKMREVGWVITNGKTVEKIHPGERSYRD